MNVTLTQFQSSKQTGDSQLMRSGKTLQIFLILACFLAGNGEVQQMNENNAHAP